MNPYAPPGAEVDGTAATARRPVAYVILVLAVLQLLWLLYFVGPTLELVKTGAVSALTALSGLVGCALLYTGAVRFALNASRGRWQFVAALVFLILALRGWGLTHFWSYPYDFAAGVAAVAGACSWRRAAPKPLLG